MLRAQIKIWNWKKIPGSQKLSKLKNRKNDIIFTIKSKKGGKFLWKK